MDSQSNDDVGKWQEAKNILSEVNNPRKEGSKLMTGGNENIQYWLEDTHKHGVIANVRVFNTGDRSYTSSQVAQILEYKGIQTGYDHLTISEDTGSIGFMTHVEEEKDVEKLSYLVDLAQTM